VVCPVYTHQVYASSHMLMIGCCYGKVPNLPTLTSHMHHLFTNCVIALRFAHCAHCTLPTLPFCPLCHSAHFAILPILPFCPFCHSAQFAILPILPFCPICHSAHFAILPILPFCPFCHSAQFAILPILPFCPICHSAHFAILPNLFLHSSVNSTADLLAVDVFNNLCHTCRVHFDTGAQDNIPEGVKTSPVNDVCDLFCPKCVDHKKGRCGHFNLCRDCVKLFWAKTNCPDGHTLYQSDRARPRQAYEAASQCAG